MRPFALVLTCCAACLFPDLSPLTGNDAGDDAMSANDADASEAAAPTCDPSAPFTSIQPIAELDDSNDQFKATLTLDELDIWYGLTTTTDAGSVTQILHASRTSRTLPFGNPTVETNLGKGGVDPGVSEDGLTLYYSQSGSIGNYDLFAASRATRSDPFGIGFQLPSSIQSTEDEIAPFVAFDKSLYFSSWRAGDHDVWRAPFVDGGLGAPAMVTSLSSTGTDIGVALTHDGLWAYVSSSRTDLLNAGGQDVFLTHRATLADDFGTPVNVTEINSASFDRANFVSSDNCRLYFESQRNGLSDLFVATKMP
jgi:hypothetical protein